MVISFKCDEESKSVEVVYKNANEEEILTKVHFQVSPKVHECTINMDVYIWYFIVLYMLGSLHLIFSAWMVTKYFLLNRKNFVCPSFISKIVTEIRNKFENGQTMVLRLFLAEKTMFHFNLVPTCIISRVYVL